MGSQTGIPRERRMRASRCERSKSEIVFAMGRKIALENIFEMKIERIDEALFDATLKRAEAAPRKRTNHNFHPSLEDNPHRFLNVMIRGTYVTPHRHLDPPKS